MYTYKLVARINDFAYGKWFDIVDYNKEKGTITIDDTLSGGELIFVMRDGIEIKGVRCG